jgi:hypothetical protein
MIAIKKVQLLICGNGNLGIYISDMMVAYEKLLKLN